MDFFNVFFCRLFNVMYVVSHFEEEEILNNYYFIGIYMFVSQICIYIYAHFLAVQDKRSNKRTSLHTKHKELVPKCFIIEVKMDCVLCIVFNGGLILGPRRWFLLNQLQYISHSREK